MVYFLARQAPSPRGKIQGAAPKGLPERTPGAGKAGAGDRARSGGGEGFRRAGGGQRRPPSPSLPPSLYLSI